MSQSNMVLYYQFLQHTWGIDQLEMLVLFQDIFILTSLESDWFDVIFSYDVKQNISYILLT